MSGIPQIGIPDYVLSVKYAVRKVHSEKWAATIKY